MTDQPQDLDYDQLREIHETKQCAERIAARSDASPASRANADQEIATLKRTLRTGRL